MVLEAKNATWREVVDALSSAFETNIELAIQADRTVTGTYSGSIRTVLLRLLEGKDYIARTSVDQMSITISSPSMKNIAAKTSISRTQLRPSDDVASTTDEGALNTSGYWGWAPR